MQTPFQIESNAFVRRLISKLELPCSKCEKSVPHGDLSAHKKQFCPKRDGTQMSKDKNLQEDQPPAFSTAESFITLEMEENSIGKLREEAKSNNLRGQSKRLEILWSKLKIGMQNY